MSNDEGMSSGYGLGRIYSFSSWRRCAELPFEAKLFLALFRSLFSVFLYWGVKYDTSTRSVVSDSEDSRP